MVLVENTLSFHDLPASGWAVPGIDRLLAAGIVSGFPDDTFRPDQAVTRAEFVKMLDLTLGITPSTGTTKFTDVASGSWFARCVSATFFDPQGDVTRKELAILLARTLHLSGGSALHFHDDGLIGTDAVQSVQAAVAEGYLQEFPDGTFRPRTLATRGQVAKVLAAVLTLQSA